MMLGAGLLVIEFNQPQNGTRLTPGSKKGIKIENEVVYKNGSVHFTARCHFKSWGGYPRPTGDQYQIRFVYLWSMRHRGYIMEFNISDDGSLEFNRTLSDIQYTSEVTVNDGDLNLAIDEEVSISFQTSYPLNAPSSIYVGLMAFGSTGLMRWEVNTTIIGG